MAYLTLVSSDADGTIAAPSAATDGKPLWRRASGHAGYVLKQGFPRRTNRIVIAWKITGSGVMALPAPKVWLYHRRMATWVFILAANNGAALAETSSDKITLSEVIDNIQAYDRIYIEQAAPTTGTVTDYDVTATNVEDA